MEEMICRAKTNGQYDSVRVSGIDLQQQLADDVKFGFLEPKNGVLKYVLQNRDREITKKQARKAVAMALFSWRMYVPITFRRTTNIAEADIIVEFRHTRDDELLDSGTLAYMYYPLGTEHQGLCVVNSEHYWTIDGESIDMHFIDPVHYPQESESNPRGKTHDLDQVLRHEFGHGVFGLPHSQNHNRIMSSNVGVMQEHLHEEDIIRAQAKAGIRQNFAHRLANMLRWYKIRSDTP